LIKWLNNLMMLKIIFQNDLLHVLIKINIIKHRKLYGACFLALKILKLLKTKTLCKNIMQVTILYLLYIQSFIRMYFYSYLL